jgi:tetratricopeptide (TPR) repeat protein
LDFSKHIQKAEEALRRRNYDFAVELFRQLVDLDPDLGDARAGLRRALRKRQEHKKGGKLLRAMSGALPLSRAKTMRKMGKHDACARALEDYLATNPLDEEGNLLLGMSLEESGHYNSARAVYEFLAEVAPKNSEGLKRAGSMMQRTGDPQGALAYYERALEADPRDQEALKARKNLAAETALASSSVDRVRHSRELIKDKAEAASLEHGRRVHLSKEDLEKRLATLEERFAESPSDPELMLEISDVHERLKDPEAALELAERALQYKRDSFDLTARVGDLKSKVLKKRLARADKEGDSDKATRIENELREFEVTDYRRRVEIRAGDASLRLDLAKRLMRVEQIDEALAELQRCQNEPRVRQEALFLLGQCFQKKGILDLAKAEFEKALEGISGVNERAKEILYHLGAIAEAQGDKEEARSLYIRIYAVDIGYRDVAQKTQELS